MTAQEIKALPKEFDFKSNINSMGLTYHAIEKEDGYVVTHEDMEWSFDKHEFRKKLLNGEYVVVGKEPKLYKVKYKVWNTSFSDLYDREMLSIGSDEEEAINRVGGVAPIDARDFIAEEITEIFGHTVIVK